MSNLNPLAAHAPRTAISHVSAAFLADPPPHAHAVQFYENDTFLCVTVARFIGAGLQAGDRVLLVTGPDHRNRILEALADHDVPSAIASGRLTVLDAEATLLRFVVDDMPDPTLFRQLVADCFAGMRAGGNETTRIRVFGEMVDILWSTGRPRAALRLEELWNEISGEPTFELLCAYVMGNFYREGDSEQFLEICRNHTHVLPTERFQHLDDPHARMVEICVLQQRARALESEIQNRRELEVALRNALREQARVEEELRSSVKREQGARAEAQASDQFKELFLGILGHDLRNPLNTILTTGRLMVLRNDLGSENGKRLARIVSSGVRMQRMIHQLLDVTRLRLGTGIPVERSEERDLGAMVGRIVDELRGGHPDRVLTVDSEGACFVRFDEDRLEQVVSNLLGNALMHGDPHHPVAVRVVLDRTTARVSVHNLGPPIDPSFVPMLFDPFKRGHQKLGTSDGLGIGLYISDRIVRAHGGKIEVTSSVEGGTRFEAWFPREP